MSIEVLYLDGFLITGTRKITTREVDRTTVDRSTLGIEVDVELEDGRQGVKLVITDVSAFELAWALLTKLDAKKINDAPYKPGSKPAERLWDELKRLFPSYQVME